IIVEAFTEYLVSMTSFVVPNLFFQSRRPSRKCLRLSKMNSDHYTFKVSRVQSRTLGALAKQKLQRD
ncbi:hypothetical protein K435DRAFT_774653, partial [Dendrothele bispora CBS 962.96]